MQSNNKSLTQSSSEAVDYALRQARKGDLIVITADNIKRTFAQIIRFRDERTDAAGV